MDCLLELAEAADVILAIEPMHPACAGDWTFLTDLPATISFLDYFDSRFLKMVLDVYHFGCDCSVLANLSEVVPRTALVQIGDRRGRHQSEQNRCPLGKGKIPLADFLQVLIEAGYQGDFDIELVGQDVQLCDYEDLLQDSRQAFQRLLAPVEGG